MENELYLHTLRQLRDGCKAEHMDTETAALEAAIQVLSCGGDCISRQAAIDALDRIFDRCEEIEAHLPEGDPDRTGYKMYPDYMTVWKYLHQLPSAQPERTCVNCGRTVNNGGWYADGRTRCPIEEHYALPKDGFCHLYEPYKAESEEEE